MDEPPIPSAPGGLQYVQRAHHIAVLETIAIARIDHSGDVDHGISIAHQQVQRGSVRQIAGDPFDTFARLLRPASQCGDGKSFGKGMVEQRLSDESGAPRNCQFHFNTSWLR
jgi:hypothetical protein